VTRPYFVAHGIGGIQDLPVPTWLFYWAGATVLVVSFVLLGALWRRPLLGPHALGTPVVERLSALVLGPLRIVAQTLSVALFAVVWVSAILGNKDAYKNFAPTWIYVIFWVGVPVLSVVFGNVWRGLSPWRALADFYVWLRELGGGRARPLAEYPENLGRWPGAVVLFAFVALELTYSDPSSPRALAFAIAIYTYIALFGMAAFGREEWCRYGEGFAVYFGLLAKIAPLYALNGRLRLRWPLSGLAGKDTTPGAVAFTGVMLGSVLFDGYSRTSTWQDLMAHLEAPYVVHRPGLGQLLVTLASLGGLLTGVLLIALAFEAAAAVARWTVNAPRSLVPDFVLSLVPIAFVYVIAHYATLFLVQGQFTVPLLSDPLGRGWNLFGTAHVTPDLTVISPNTTWYVQVVALVSGHVAGLAIAHDRAVALFVDRRDALRSQYAMLALMVLYTVGGLWVLSRG
jgi:hypothetical protein